MEKFIGRFIAVVTVICDCMHGEKFSIPNLFQCMCYYVVKNEFVAGIFSIYTCAFSINHLYKHMVTQLINIRPSHPIAVK